MPSADDANLLPRVLTRLDDAQGSVAIADEQAPLPGALRAAAFVGPAIEYTIDTAVGELFAVTSTTDSAFAAGMRVGIALLPHGLAVLPREAAS